MRKPRKVSERHGWHRGGDGGRGFLPGAGAWPREALPRDLRSWAPQAGGGEAGGVSPRAVGAGGAASDSREEGGAEGWGGAGLTTAPTCPPGEVSPVLAGRALRPLPVLRGGSYGGIQHASVHPAGVQGHGRPGKYRDRPSRQLTVPLLVWRGLSWLGSGSKGPGVGWKRSAWASWTVTPTTE